MSHYIHFWLRLFLLFLGLLAFLSFVTTALKPKSENGKTNWRWPGSMTRLMVRITFGGRVNLRHDFIVFTLGFFSCLFWVQVTAYAAYHSRWTYYEVLVKARYSDKHFLLQPERMQPWDDINCTPSDWQVGQKMKFIHLEPSQDGSCKDIVDRGYFEFHTDPRGNRLQYE